MDEQGTNGQQPKRPRTRRNGTPKRGFLERAEEIFKDLPRTPSVHHPRSPDASPERLRELAGSIELTKPLPKNWKKLWLGRGSGRS